MSVKFEANLFGVKLETFAEHINIALPEMVRWEIPVDVHFPEGALMMWTPPQVAQLMGFANANFPGLVVYNGILFNAANPGNTRAKVEVSSQGSINRKWKLEWCENQKVSSSPERSKGNQVRAARKVPATTPTTLPFRFLVAEINAVYYDDRLHVIVSTPKNGQWDKHFREWLKPRWGHRLKELAPGKATMSGAILLPSDPPIPGAEDYTWHDLFDWWYRGGRLIEYQTLKSLASALPFSIGTTNNNHSRYTREYGMSPMPDGRSRYVGMITIVNIVHDEE